MEKYNKIFDISLGIDELTGLEKMKNVYNIFVMGKDRKVIVEYEICLVTPNGYVAEKVYTGKHETLDEAPNHPYTAYEASAVGQGIKYIISQNINSYPNE